MARRVVDPVGAGDALLAYGTLTMMRTGNPVIASIVGSIAAGLECERDGNHPVLLDKVLGRIDQIERQVKFGMQPDDGC
jgi:sugar/nucleoside kinase (ribokinase family)